MDILCNYQGFCKCTLIVVFDAYRVQGHACEISKYHNIHVVYTAEAETADQYIEKTVHEIGQAVSLLGPAPGTGPGAGRAPAERAGQISSTRKVRVSLAAQRQMRFFPLLWRNVWAEALSGV